MANTSRSSKPINKGQTQPNTKVRKLRTKIKKSKNNLKHKTAPTKGIRSYSRHRQKAKKRKTLATSMFVAVTLLSSAGMVIAIGWISILFIFNPQMVSWLNPFLPEWAQITSGSKKPHTLKQIKAQIKRQKRISGKILPLENNTDESFLLPIYLDRKNCNSDCKYIVELRTYQRATDFEWQSSIEKYYHLTNNFAVTGPEEFEVIAPLVEAGIEENPGSTIALPVTEIKRFEKDAPKSGIWYYLRGNRSSGSNLTAYGYILHYNLKRRKLQTMISWTSPTGDLPQWQQVTGDGDKELVIRQTIGLEPRLRIYQTKPSEFVINPITLAEITLKPPALKDRAYKNALLIARNGLWTPSNKWLQFIKKQQKAKITPAAQAQIDLISEHSQLTKKLADTSWASPSQQVLAYLIDGRWGEALKVFEALPQNPAEIRNLLKSDTGRIESRIDAALEVNPNRSEVQAWKALIIASKQSTNQGYYWLKTQSNISKTSQTYIQKLLAQI
ncbi:hypothetical protein Riv7116_4131 [Rivularia sp. PCC 7116]|uniref:hypothetical protein n=1 Tax=Rivularia sp. PCC 7116 TaxID=373994 RepID=UPI00029ED9E1|nr:hypothetical protein [Rivularia sp. PCC 7116]AFY56565.1 hypothetical protein Riv7116_4131 [Rivularia sp. PCC 7116]